jgi:hypothetical protein
LAPYGDSQRYYSDPITLSLGNSDLNDVEIRATRGAVIAGRIVMERNGAIESISDSPIFIDAFKWQTDGGSSRIGEVRTGADGSFRLENVRPGKIQLRSSGLPPGAIFIGVEHNGGRVTDGFQVSAGDDLEGVRVLIACGTGSIEGQANVVGNGLPSQRGWIVSVRRCDQDDPLVQLVDARGHFWVKDLPPGDYEVIADANYVEVPGVTPTPYPAPLKQTVSVRNGTESHVLLVLDLTGLKK